MGCAVCFLLSNLNFFRTEESKNTCLTFDSWTFYGISENKLILAHQVGQRDSDTCWSFLMKMKSAVGTGRFQLTTDGLAAYRSNVPFAFQSQVDFAVLIKNYSSSQETARYSPAKITNIEKLPMFGDCD